MGNARPLQDFADIASYDAGTLWRMTRNGWAARCALWSFPDRWELRVTVDAKLLLTQSSPRVSELFALAEEWKTRMTREGWTRVVPDAGHARRDAGPAAGSR